MLPEQFNQAGVLQTIYAKCLTLMTCLNGTLRVRERVSELEKIRHFPPMHHTARAEIGGSDQRPRQFALCTQHDNRYFEIFS